MKISHFSAQSVNGYLAFDIPFREDFTFLIGLNGSGKTTVLRLIMALVTPDIPEIAAIAFDRASIRLGSGQDVRTIEAERTLEQLSISVDGVDEKLVLSAAELTLIQDPKGRDEPDSPILAKANESAVVKTIRDMGTPMYLGLDRRLVGDLTVQDPGELRRREFFHRQMIQEQGRRVLGHVAAALSDVNLLVFESMGEIRQQQEELDSEFRNRLLVSLFSYEPAEIKGIDRPSSAAINQYRAKQNDIESAIKSLQLPLRDVRAALDGFFEKMNEIVAEMQRDEAGQPVAPAKGRTVVIEPVGSGKRSRRYGAHEPPQQQLPPKAMPLPSRGLIEWFVNKPQIDRIMAQLTLLEDYNLRRSALREPIDRFLRLVNSFLEDTGKRIAINEKGALRVERLNGDALQVVALSSGERQLLVMLGQLTLNKQLAGSGVFIVDEPELSLHISWQERFVDAVREANEDLQLIMATHSPAIILDRDAHCESLDGHRA